MIPTFIEIDHVVSALLLSDRQTDMKLTGGFRNESNFPFRISGQNFVLISHLSHECYMPHPSHPP